MIYEKPLDLVTIPDPNCFLVHAVNAQGVWGAGIAKQFKKAYRDAFQKYRDYCEDYDDIVLAGCSLITQIPNGAYICNLVTSRDYGKNKDGIQTILLNTELAINEAILQLKMLGWHRIYSNKFNSGLFGVPWEQTLSIIERVLSFPENQHIEWIICVQNTVKNRSSNL